MPCFWSSSSYIEDNREGRCRLWNERADWQFLISRSDIDVYLLFVRRSGACSLWRSLSRWNRGWYAMLKGVRQVVWWNPVWLGSVVVSVDIVLRTLELSCCCCSCFSKGLKRSMRLSIADWDSWPRARTSTNLSTGGLAVVGHRVLAVHCFDRHY